ncbi:hypothetical protein GQ42DRAFT_106080, partial [Ramicandelaber brevisporus]
ADAETSPTTASTEPKLSKNALKRLKKDQSWEAKKEQRKVKRKAEKQKRQANKRARVEAGELPEAVFKPRFARNPQPSGVTIIIDMSFNDLMSDVEIKSMARQLGRCYSVNKRSERPAELVIASLTGKMKDSLTHSFPGHANWEPSHVRLESKDMTELYPKDRLVYLSADSTTCIDTLSKDDVYIIGGLVDKNRYKNLTLNKAKELGIRTAQLPIGQYVEMASRKVITVNQVYEILAGHLEGATWEKAFLDVIPKRK